jgi:chorismate mutase
MSTALVSILAAKVSSISWRQNLAEEVSSINEQQNLAAEIRVRLAEVLADVSRSEWNLEEVSGERQFSQQISNYCRGLRKIKIIR